ncbi:MAG: hypothetical protein ABSH41_28030 [Syntrophobacteraceae bacterium]|jgi:hypothetical protein
MSAEKIELIIKAIESGDVGVALNLARSALETMNKEGEVKESSSDYPMPESMLYYNGPEGVWQASELWGNNTDGLRIPGDGRKNLFRRGVSYELRRD